MPTVIHVSPHPDDESIAVPCTLLALQDQGWHVVNLACSLGRPEDWDRRRGELERAVKVAGFENRVLPEPLAISRADNYERASRRLAMVLRGIVAETGATLVVGPHPRDVHHGHTAVARAIRKVVWTSRPRLTWWMWSIWSDLPRPTLVVDCRESRLEISERMLGEYEGENGRNDYLSVHRHIRAVNVVRGAERAFGFGSTPRDWLTGVAHAELLTEVTRHGPRWMVGRPRLLDPADPLQTEWVRLDDVSILSTTSLRPLYVQQLMSVYQPFSPAGTAPHGQTVGGPEAVGRSSSSRCDLMRKPRAR